MQMMGLPFLLQTASLTKTGSDFDILSKTPYALAQEIDLV